MGMEVRFVTKLVACPVGRSCGRRIWELKMPFVVHIGDTEIVVPAGFQTDYASVPRLPVTYALFGDSGHEGATIHDYGYRIGAVPDVPKAEVDLWFKAIMDCLGEPPWAWRRWLMYKAVCWFANGCWKKNEVMARLA